MKQLLFALAAIFIAWPASATQDSRGPTLEQRVSSQKAYQLPWIPTQRKWISTKLLGADEQPFFIIVLLYPDQACSMIPDRNNEIECYWHWQFRPDAPRDIRDDEALVRLGSYFAWVTEQDYCDMVKGTHQMSSPKLDAICRESWMEFYQQRGDIPDAMKIMVHPF